jgi:soluble lytic murein transglycosylase-like protein
VFQRITSRLLLAVATPALAVFPVCARAAEHVMLKNGFAIDCSRREIAGDQLRLYALGASDSSYVEVPMASVLRIEPLAEPMPAPAVAAAATTTPSGALLVASAASHSAAFTSPSTANVPALLAAAGALHRIDVTLLAAVVHAESNGRTTAVSRTGAKGLMQLMPQTASDLGVHDAFVPEQNVAGGTAYLDQLLNRYHDDLALALAAYNAGPRAVDRYHGVPPYPETRAYVARIIREFNRQVLAARAKASSNARAADVAATHLAARSMPFSPGHSTSSLSSAKGAVQAAPLATLLPTAPSAW